MSLPNPINVTYVAPSVDETFPFIYIVKDTDNIINIDTTNGEVFVILRNIQNSGVLQFQPLLSINDGGNNASVNNIYIFPSLGDLINDAGDFILNTDGANSIFQISNINQWVVLSTQTSGGGGGGLTMDGFVGITSFLNKIVDSGGTASPLQISTTSVTSYGGGDMNTNTAFGDDSLVDNGIGENNTGFGNAVLFKNIEGNYNTAIGSFALRDNLVGESNTAIGYQSLYNNLANYNTAIGTSTLRNNEDGTNNIAIGYRAMYDNITGNYNIAIGDFCMDDDEEGSENIAIGNGISSNDNNNSLMIGRSASVSGDNQVAIGSASFPLGAVNTEDNTSSKYWEVIINGNVEKILLA
jgi:hypothetical protein